MPCCRQWVKSLPLWGNGRNGELMKIEKMQESIELCTEAGWYAYDFYLDEPVGKELILAFRGMGELAYLSMLRQPFYRVERQYLMIKGLEGQPQFRAAMYKDEEAQVLKEITEFIARYDSEA